MDESQLDPAAELSVREELTALTKAELEQRQVTRRWSKIKQLAPTFWSNEAVEKITTSLIDVEMRRHP